jgi:hypothetical protein
VIAKDKIWFNRQFFQNEVAIDKLQTSLLSRLKLESDQHKKFNELELNKYEQRKREWDDELRDEINKSGNSQGWPTMGTRKVNLIEQVTGLVKGILDLGIPVSSLYDIGQSIINKSPTLFARNSRVSLPFGGKTSAQSRDFYNKRIMQGLTGKALDEFTAKLIEAKLAAHDPEIDIRGNILGKLLLKTFPRQNHETNMHMYA